MSAPLKLIWDAPGHWGALVTTLLSIGTEVSCDWLADAVCDLEALKEKHANVMPQDMRIEETVKAHKEMLESSKFLTHGQLAVLFPKNGTPELDRFDIPLVYAMVRQVFPTPEGNIDPGWSGWTKDPPPSHQGGIFEIIRLRSLFAEFRATAPDDISDEDFRRLWIRLRGAILRLSAENRRSQVERALGEKRSTRPGEERITQLRVLIGAEQEDNKKEEGRRTSRQGRGSGMESVPTLTRTDSILQGGKLPESVTGRRTSVGRKAFRAASGPKAALITKFRAAGHKVIEDVRQQAARAKNKLGPGQTDEEDCPSYILRPMNKVAEFLKARYEELFAKYRPLSWYERLELSLDALPAELLPVEDSSGRRDACTLLDLFSDADKLGRRVLIEGDYSSGKTTACRRLTLDWAKGKLPHFRIVFLIHMKHVHGSLLDNLFKDLKKISGTSVNRDEFFTFIRCHQSELLFILDGIDEMDPEIADQCDVLAELLRDSSDGPNSPTSPISPVDGIGLAATIGRSSLLLTSRPLVSPISGVDARYRLQGFTRDTASQFITRQLVLRQDKDSAEASLRWILRHLGSHPTLIHPFTLALLCDMADADWPPREPPPTVTQVLVAILDRILEEFGARNVRFCRSHGFEGAGVAEHLELLGELAWKGLRDGRLTIPVKTLQQQIGVKKAELLMRLGLLTVHESEAAIGSTKEAEFAAKPWAELCAAWWLASRARKEGEDLRPLLREIHVADFFYQVASSKRLHNPAIFQFAFGLLAEHSEAAVKLLKTLCEDAQGAAREHDVFPWWCACYACIDEAGEAGPALAAALLPFIERKLLSLDFDRGRQNGTRGLVAVMRAQQLAGRGHGVRFESGEALKELLSELGDDRYRYDLVEVHVDSWECWQDDDDLHVLCARLLSQFRCRVLRLSIPPMFCTQALHESVLPLLGSSGVTTLALDFHLEQLAAPSAGDDSSPKMVMDEVVLTVARTVSTCRELRYLRVQFAACPDVQFECSSRALQTLNEAIDARGPRLTVDLSWPFVE